MIEVEESQQRRKDKNSHDWEWFSEFCGVTLSSNYYVFHIMSKIISENPQIQKIIEIGTFKGGFATYLGLEGLRRDVEVFTYNIEKQTSKETDKILNGLMVNQVIMDVFKDRDTLFQNFDVPCFLICDGGYKEAEFIMSVPELKSGSIISVHDYGVECDNLKHERALPYLEETWKEHNSQFATWKIK